jgi:S-adenosylmethionine-diacylglycerol 3-amino-3-carboxypropyl transferase
MTGLRYAQCWEDADVLLEGLDVRPGDICLSIASAGDNTLALLSRNPQRVIAIDRRPEQIACFELRVGAYRNLTHGELLELLGAEPSRRRGQLYRRCRGSLSAQAREFWDARPRIIERGIGHAGKFERYLALFSRYVLPCVHRRSTVAALLAPRTKGERARFYARTWNTRLWRLLYHVFFSRFVMMRLGRDRECFSFASGRIAGQLLERSRIALCTQDLTSNPYLQWICTGRYLTALPFALRPENFERIRANLDRLEWHCGELEQYLERAPADSVDRFNLSDVFEYLSPQTFERVMGHLLRVGRRNGRLMYWTLFARRKITETPIDRWQPLDALAARLHRRQKTFFYGGLFVGQSVKPAPHPPNPIQFRAAGQQVSSISRTCSNRSPSSMTVSGASK